MLFAQGKDFFSDSCISRSTTFSLMKVSVSLFSATRHTEAVIVLYKPEECTYESLLDVFFERVDPLTVNGQGSDRGTQYRTGIYYHSKEQEEVAMNRFVEEQKRYKRKIATECKAALPFWPAEKYHQQYLEKGGRFQSPQSAEKGCTDTIRCYG